MKSLFKVVLTEIYMPFNKANGWVYRVTIKFTRSSATTQTTNNTFNCKYMCPTEEKLQAKTNT